MKNTILSQIIKNTILLEQVGFVPRKKKPPVVDPTPVTPKKPKVKKVTPDPKKDPKKPEPAKIKPGEDRIITPPENRKQHMIYNKASDGKWYWEVYSAYDDTLKTGLVTDGTVLAKLNTRNGTKKWDGKYNGEKLDKKTWLKRMDMFDPSHPKNTVEPMLSNEAWVTAMTASYWIAGAVALLFSKKIFKGGVRLIKWFGRPGSQSVELSTLGGLSSEGVMSMKQWTEYQYGIGQLTKSERNQIRGIYNNKSYWRVISTNTFNAMKRDVILGNRTMAELITVMPAAFREEKDLVDALLKYERTVLNMYPGREAKWLVAAEKWAKQQSLNRTEIKKLFPELGLPPIKPKKPISKTNPGVYDFYSNTSTSGLTAADFDAKAIIDKAKKAAEKVAKAKAATKLSIEAMVDGLVKRTSGFVNQRRSQKLPVTKYDIYSTPKNTVEQWEMNIGSKTLKGNDIIKLRDELVKLSTEKAAINKIKAFAVTHNWNANYSKYIETFLQTMLPYYRK